VVNVTGHGGERAGAGRPSGPQTEDQADYNLWRARNEKAKAQTAEFDLEIKRGAYLPRETVAAAAATAFASFAQHCRGIGGMLERNLGVKPEIAEAVEREIDTALESLSLDLQRLHKAGGEG
jgi:hypothetical protein